MVSVTSSQNVGNTLADQLTLYESWNLRQPTIPPCSRLYHLEPVGIGTPYAESLTSYIARLATAHCVSTGTLFAKELAPLINKAYVLGTEHSSLSGRFRKSTRALNGVGVIATEWVQVLETLTLQTNLHFLTMLTWAEVVPSRSLLRSVRAWCPVCYAEWYTTQQVIYEPLLWSINTVTVCPRHCQPLSFYCFSCNQQLPLLDRQSRPGYCSRCSQWLGNYFNTNNCDYKALTEDELKWQMWVADTVGQLIAAAPYLTSLPVREKIAATISAYVDQVAAGNIAEFARSIQMPKNTVWSWYVGKVLPQLEVLLGVCRYLGTSLLQFLTQEIDYTEVGSISTKGQNRIKRTFRKSPRRVDPTKLQRGLETVLEAQGFPPVSLKEIARRLGYDGRILHRHNPDLCRTISERYANYQEIRGRQKTEELCEEARRIAFELDAQGRYPSNTSVSTCMAKPGSIRNKKVRTELHNIRCELGWEK